MLSAAKGTVKGISEANRKTSDAVVKLYSVLREKRVSLWGLKAETPIIPRRYERKTGRFGR